MDGKGLNEGKFQFSSSFVFMDCLCCFPMLTRWFEDFQRLDVNEHEPVSRGREGVVKAEYRDITQRFIDETNSMLFYRPAHYGTLWVQSDIV